MAEEEKKKAAGESEKRGAQPEKSDDRKEDTPSALEWIFAALGLAVVLVAVGFLIYRGATRADAPPQIKIEVESVARSSEQYVVNFRVSNTGDTTAAVLTVEGALKTAEPENREEETSEMTLTYLPAQSVRRGSLFFTKNPNEYRLEIRAKGFERP